MFICMCKHLSFMYIPLVMSVFCNDMSFCNFALPPLSICGSPTQVSSLCELVMIGDDKFNELLKDTTLVVVYIHLLHFQIMCAQT